MSKSAVDGPLAVTMGEPAGIGGDLTLAAWRACHAAGPAFVAFDDPDRLAALADRLDWRVPVTTVADPEAGAAQFGHALPVIPVPLSTSVEPGQLDRRNGPAVLASIRHAVAACRDGACSGLVTNPVQKVTLYAAGLDHPGHTELLAELCGAAGSSWMMLTAEQLSPPLRVVPLTVHMALRDVPAAVTHERILNGIAACDYALRRDFGLPEPKLALAGLNPHAGEDGTMGDEEARVLSPALAAARTAGYDLAGPLAADTLFHAQGRAGFDAILGCYHDQVLIPLKTLAFDGGVNVTLNLPIVRTSPDHGTALTLAGTGRARPESFLAALRLAARLAAHRRNDVPRS